MADGLHFSSSLTTGNMDEILDKLSKGFSEKERWEINKPAAQVYEKSLKYHLAHNLNPTRNGIEVPQDDGTKKEYVRNRHHKEEEGQNTTDTTVMGYRPRDRQDLLDAIDYNKEHGGAVKVGFTRKSEKAYIGRFLNDGWDPRNQHGGPYQHVEGEHFFEKSADDSDEAIKETEKESLLKVLKRKGL